MPRNDDDKYQDQARTTQREPRDREEIDVEDEPLERTTRVSHTTDDTEEDELAEHAMAQLDADDLKDMEGPDA